MKNDYSSYKYYFGHGGFTHAGKFDISKMKVSSIDHRTLYPDFPMIKYPTKEEKINE